MATWCSWVWGGQPWLQAEDSPWPHLPQLHAWGSHTPAAICPFTRMLIKSIQPAVSTNIHWNPLHPPDSAKTSQCCQRLHDKSSPKKTMHNYTRLVSFRKPGRLPDEVSNFPRDFIVVLSLPLEQRYPQPFYTEGFFQQQQNHWMVWAGKVLVRPYSSNSLPWAGISPTRSGWPKSNPAWPWAPAGTGQLFSGQPVPIPHHPLSKVFLPSI